MHCATQTSQMGPARDGSSGSRSIWVGSPISLPARYAMPDTDIANGACLRACTTMPVTAIACDFGLDWRYATLGTGRAYGISISRCAVLT
eukprot:3318334-Rhodomonas_salina.1